MGVFRGRGAEVDVRAIADAMAPAVRLWETVYVIIMDPGEFGAKVKAKDNSAFLWYGLARVQPYRREVATAAITNPTTNQSVRFQIDFSEDGVIPLIRTDYQVIVLPESLSGVPLNDPALPTYQHVVRSALNSSLAWIRTIETQVNTEVRTNYGNLIQGNPVSGFTWKP